MPPITTTLPVDLTLHLAGTICHTTSALSDSPRPEVQTLAIESISLTVRDRVEGLDGVATYIPREVDLTSGLGAASGNLGMFLNRFLDALGQDADDALLEAGE